MFKQREKDLWKELDKFAFLASALVMTLLIIGYFLIAGVGTGEAQIIDVAQMFVLNIIANLIPVFLLFVGSYAILRRIQTLKSERDAEELSELLAEKVAARVLQSLFEVAAHNSGTSNPKQKEFSAEEKFSILISNEFQITNKFFDDIATPQRLVVEFTNPGSTILHVTKVKFAATQELPESAFHTSYRTEGGGRHIIVPFDASKAEVLPGQQFVIELGLAQKWERNRIYGLAGKWGYLKPQVIYDGKSVELFYSI